VSKLNDRVEHILQKESQRNKLLKRESQFYQVPLSSLSEPQLLKLDAIELPSNQQHARFLGLLNHIPIGRQYIQISIM